MKARIISALLALGMLLAFFAQQALALSELTHFTARIGDSPAVYSGPGKEYYRANNGKAQYGKGGVARIYGLAAGGWMMIGYELGSGDYRIGYVAPKYAEMLYDIKDNDGRIPALKLDSIAATITSACNLTDDPVIHTKPIAELPAGTAVTYLATLGNWAYVEVNSDIGLARAFVRKEYVSTSGGPATPPAQGEQHNASWASMYRQYLLDSGSADWLALRLVDLDFDGMPELLITTDRAHVGTLVRVLAIRNGRITASEYTVMEMDGNSEWDYPADIQLFYNSGSAQYEWLIFDGYVMGDYRSSMVSRLSFENGAASTRELFRHESQWNEQTRTEYHTYYISGRMETPQMYGERIDAFRSQLQSYGFPGYGLDLLSEGLALLPAFDQLVLMYR